MTTALFAFLAEAVATPASTYRSGARHALMIFAAGQSRDEARSLALAKTHDSHWSLVEIRRQKELGSDTDQIADDTLRSAAQAAMARGAAIVVYRDEIPADC